MPMAVRGQVAPGTSLYRSLVAGTESERLLPGHQPGQCDVLLMGQHIVVMVVIYG